MSEERRKSPDNELNDAEESLARQAGMRLRDSSEQLDAATRSRLNRARQRALDEMPGKARAGWWVPAGVTAIAATIVIGIWQISGPQNTSIPAPVIANNVEDFELLLEEGDLEMIEDLEFFAWLANEDLETPG